MKGLIAYCFVLLLLLQSGAKLFILASFKINQAEIARTLCENKARPQMKCNGKCYLKKQLKAQDSKEQNRPDTGKKIPLLLLDFRQFTEFCFAPSGSFRMVSLSEFYISGDYASPSFGHFRPPRIA